MPWGMYFPGSLLRRQPTSLFAAILFLLIWLFLLWVEPQWRMWSWYKSQASGFVFLASLELLLLVNLLLAFWQDIKVYFFWLEVGLNLVALLVVSFVFYRHSGKQIGGQDAEKKEKK